MPDEEEDVLVNPDDVPDWGLETVHPFHCPGCSVDLMKGHSPIYLLETGTMRTSAWIDPVIGEGIGNRQVVDSYSLGISGDSDESSFESVDTKIHCSACDYDVTDLVNKNTEDNPM